MTEKTKLTGLPRSSRTMTEGYCFISLIPVFTGITLQVTRDRGGWSYTNLQSKEDLGGKEEATRHTPGRHPAYSTIRRGADDDDNNGKQMNATWYQNEAMALINQP